jgi:GTPase SAR1 family protein
MIISKILEIKVALLGYVSVGKSTVPNALFQDSYAEV